MTTQSENTVIDPKFANEAIEWVIRTLKQSQSEYLMGSLIKAEQLLDLAIIDLQRVGGK